MERLRTISLARKTEHRAKASRGEEGVRETGFCDKSGGRSEKSG